MISRMKSCLSLSASSLPVMLNVPIQALHGPQDLDRLPQAPPAISLPSTAMVSNSGGVAVRPVTATRIGMKSSLGFQSLRLAEGAQRLLDGRPRSTSRMASRCSSSRTRKAFAVCGGVRFLATILVAPRRRSRRRRQRRSRRRRRSRPGCRCARGPAAGPAADSRRQKARRAAAPEARRPRDRGCTCR